MDTQEPSYRKPKSNKGLKIALWVLSILLTAAVTAVVCLLIFGKDNNQQAKVSDDKVAKQEESAKAPEIALNEYCSKNEKLCFEYPDNWTVKDTPWSYPEGGLDPKVDYDKLVFSSPDGTAKVGFTNGISGIGGYCDPSDNKDQAYIINTKKTKITNFKENSSTLTKDAYAVAIVIYSAEDSNYTPRIGLSRSQALVDNKQAGGCDVGYFGHIEGRNAQNEGTMLLADGLGFGEVHQQKSYKTLDEAKKALESQSSKEMFDIVASAHYK